MKRHPALISLSHDHHEGLVIAQCLIRGYSKAAAFQWPDTAEGQAAELADFFDRALLPHFRAEEKVVFPMARESLDVDGRELVGRLIEEHGRMRDLARQLGEQPSNRSLLQEFGKLLESHIRLEERLLFESLQNSLSEEEMQRMGRRLEDFERTTDGKHRRRPD
jgi:hemerythrin-like domain-containing protein